MKRCEMPETTLSALHDGGLTPLESLSVRAHVALCPDCAKTIRAWRELDRRLVATDPARRTPAPAPNRRLVLASAVGVAATVACGALFLPTFLSPVPAYAQVEAATRAVRTAHWIVSVQNFENGRPETPYQLEYWYRADRPALIQKSLGNTEAGGSELATDFLWLYPRSGEFDRTPEGDRETAERFAHELLPKMPTDMTDIRRERRDSREIVVFTTRTADATGATRETTVRVDPATRRLIGTESRVLDASGTLVRHETKLVLDYDAPAPETLFRDASLIGPPGDAPGVVAPDEATGKAVQSLIDSACDAFLRADPAEFLALWDLDLVKSRPGFAQSAAPSESIEGFWRGRVESRGPQFRRWHALVRSVEPVRIFPTRDDCAMVGAGDATIWRVSVTVGREYREGDPIHGPEIFYVRRAADGSLKLVGWSVPWPQFDALHALAGKR